MHSLHMHDSVWPSFQPEQYRFITSTEGPSGNF
ncbi:MAG: hypothetical protein JW395_3605 [Nitrospira sp.]|nr:hypothetical protein [Nitrospira sp.]